jgi:hypothetical protein
MGIKNNQLFEYELLSSKIVFVDGITRTGKAMLNNLLLGFENMSSIQFLNPLERLMPIFSQGKIDKNTFTSYLRLFLNENFYNYNLSRNLNFRYDDLTSIYNSENPVSFLKNLSKKDGDEIVKELEKNELYFQFQTHDLLTHYSKFLELKIEVSIIELFRHPVDTIHSWYVRGWGRRFDNADKRSGTTLFKYKSYTIPHYVIGYEEEYITLNEMEKCIFMHNLLVRKSIAEYKKLSSDEKQKILILRYEDMLNSPKEQLIKISNFLDLRQTTHMEKMMVDARVPRKIDLKKRENKLEEIKYKSDLKYFNDLVTLAEEYENKFYGL